jgi:hypothetical protein
MGDCTCLLLDAVGWICLLVMAHTRHAGIGLGNGVLWACGLKSLVDTNLFLSEP